MTARAHAEMYALLRRYKPRGVLHCYSGSAEDAAWLVDQGLCLGFGGSTTYKNAKAGEQGAGRHPARGRPA